MAAEPSTPNGVACGLECKTAPRPGPSTSEARCVRLSAGTRCRTQLQPEPARLCQSTNSEASLLWALCPFVASHPIVRSSRRSPQTNTKNTKAAALVHRRAPAPASAIRERPGLPCAAAWHPPTLDLVPPEPRPGPTHAPLCPKCRRPMRRLSLLSPAGASPGRPAPPTGATQRARPRSVFECAGLTALCVRCASQPNPHRQSGRARPHSKTLRVSGSRGVPNREAERAFRGQHRVLPVQASPGLYRSAVTADTPIDPRAISVSSPAGRSPIRPAPRLPRSRAGTFLKVFRPRSVPPSTAASFNRGM
jgi:hypothetical protein